MQPASRPAIPRPAPATPEATPQANQAVQSQIPVLEIRKETNPVSTVPHRVSEADSRDSATIGKAVKVVGQIFAKEDLHVDGDVEGAIESTDNKVTVGATGRVQAAIKAREVVIFGHVQGNVEATEKVDVRREARLIGDITAARIAIEDGAVFKGRIDIQRPQSKPASDGVAVAATSSSASASPIAGAAIASPYNH